MKSNNNGTTFTNIAERLAFFAKQSPNKVAVSFPKFDKTKEAYDYPSLTFKELDELSNKFALSLIEMGFKQGDKTLLFLRPSLEFSAMTFALFKVGLVPVFIDPGMGKENLLKCIKECSPIGLIAEKEVHFIKLFFRNAFKSVKLNVTNGKIAFGKTKTIASMKLHLKAPFEIAKVNLEDTAAILFTSGGTGAPKGVVYTHQIFNAQTDILSELFSLTPEDIDLPAFPLFSLFTIAMGMKSAIPDMDPSKPALCDPKKLYQNILDNSPSFVAGSPAIWERVADYCLENNLKLPSIKYLVMFGAPVSVNLHRKFRTVLTNGTTYTPYGATESLPVSNISGKFILENTANLTEVGKGTCIGKVVPYGETKIIALTDKVISTMSEAKILNPYEVGEIIIKGPMVTKEYLNLPEKTAEAKIYEDESKTTLWHRMGDMGYLDNEGMLWFLGRKAHRVETSLGLMTPISCEAIFNMHPAVKRSALVGLGKLGSQTPAIVIERKDGQYLSGKERNIFESELLFLANKYEHTAAIKKIYLSQKFPVDVRHNIKIDRKKLKEEIEEHEKN